DEQQDEAAWDAALRNSSVQLAQQDLRLSNVDLLKTYGANAWRLHNFQQEAMHSRASAAETEKREATDRLN
ncbi:hypothetical protein ABXW19_12355, partial [Streptococcus suis]|uniref:hypothetical protein n=1 Tax=Streptococcus suis TaxID=1307 RepID=UPI003CFB2ACF